MWNLHKIFKVAVWSFIIFAGWSAWDASQNDKISFRHNQQAGVLQVIEKI